jgi:hypothetical protein
MNDRAQAIAILKQARDMLADRLSERVIDARDEILEDAHGFSFVSEIEAIYEEFGARLVHLNQLLANLPAVDEPPPVSADVEEASVHSAEIHFGAGHAELSSEGPSAVTRTYVGLVGPALPTFAESAAEPLRTLTFQPFAAQIHAGDLTDAGRSLAELFGLPEPRGEECARYFAEHLRSEPGFLMKAVQLRGELESGGWQAALGLLGECFGLAAFESLGVLQALRARFDLGEENG